MYLPNPGRLSRQKEKEKSPQAGLFGNNGLDFLKATSFFGDVSSPFGGVDFESKIVGDEHGSLSRVYKTREQTDHLIIVTIFYISKHIIHD